MVQYSALRCVSDIWQNNEKPLISNGLRFIVTCLPTAALWVLFHLAGHGSSHEVWHNWAVAHIVSCLLFMAFVIAHIKTHGAWYKSLFRNGLGRKSRVTVIVSILFMLVAMTGCVLLGVEGANSGIGLWHYRIGLLSVVLFGGHILKRIPVLRKFAK